MSSKKTIKKFAKKLKIGYGSKPVGKRLIETNFLFFNIQNMLEGSSKEEKGSQLNEFSPSQIEFFWRILQTPNVREVCAYPDKTVENLLEVAVYGDQNALEEFVFSDSKIFKKKDLKEQIVALMTAISLDNDSLRAELIGKDIPVSQIISEIRKFFDEVFNNGEFLRKILGQ